MQKFLEAAAEGKLWTEREDFSNESMQQTTSRSRKSNSLRKSKSFESMNLQLLKTNYFKLPTR